MTCTCGGSREDAGLGEGWCQLRRLAQRGCGGSMGSPGARRDVRVTCVRPQAASGGSEPWGVAAQADPEGGAVGAVC